MEEELKKRDRKVEEVIEKAKKSVERAYGGTKRNWLEATPPHSYESRRYKVKVFVLEGSPPKGYIIADYCYGIVKAFTVGMQHLHTWKVYVGGCA